MKAQDYKISSEKFVFHQNDGKIHDKKLDTKPKTYFQDAFYRFTRNKASIVAAIIIILLMFFAIVGPFFTPYSVSYYDGYYKFCEPKLQLFYDLRIPFWDGGRELSINQLSYDQYRAMETEIGRPILMNEPEAIVETYMGMKTTKYLVRIDSYNVIGIKYCSVTHEQYEAIQKYQDEHNVQIIYPITDIAKRPTSVQDKENPNIWYQTKTGKGNKTEIVYDDNGKLIPIYQANDGKDSYTSKMLVEGDEKLYNYARATDNDTMWEIRVDYREYYIYQHAMANNGKGDGITEPLFIFGSNNFGKDIYTSLASGARFSFLFAILVSTINLLVGAIYGSIEGYYGGKIDIIMERIVDLLTAVPFTIVITLLRYHAKELFPGLDNINIVILFIAFFLTGWTGMASRTRMQFYRYKNQEYVLVARTLGANDRRVMFKHIFPNAIGTLITGSVLIIPGVILSETSLSYLGIINLSTGNLTSVGTLLANGQPYLKDYPYIILFPALFISLLMLSFNLFGNGLRDAFNPSLRGTEE